MKTSITSSSPDVPNADASNADVLASETQAGAETAGTETVGTETAGTQTAGAAGTVSDLANLDLATKGSAVTGSDATGRVGLWVGLGTALAMMFFAANSVLARAALVPAPEADGGLPAMDPVSFSFIRLLSGAIVLSLIVAVRDRRKPPDEPGALTRFFATGSGGSPIRLPIPLPIPWGAIFLLMYALPFSMAYVRLSAGTGALLLFAAVQLTMMAVAVVRGERPSGVQWLAWLGAIGGVAYFVWPGAPIGQNLGQDVGQSAAQGSVPGAPEPVAALGMILAGVGWGAYSVLGKSSPDPTATTKKNFAIAAALAVPMVASTWEVQEGSGEGVLLAIGSGALASGLGYALWYACVKRLAVSQAALVQLTVPILATVAGVVFMGEPATTRLIVASVVILGSVGLGVVTRRTSTSG